MSLVVGPLLRYVGETEATVWVETDRPCEVEVLGHGSRTFAVEGHHYAIVHVEGLEPGASQEYEVALDGERAWPEPDSKYPPSVIRTIDPARPIKLAFGSCRVTVPHEPPYTLTKDQDDRGREHDALNALALRMLETPDEEWPQALLLLGDQVYADEVSPGVRQFIRSRRDVREPPGEQVADFEEYTRLYWESWRDPVIRWLLSTVSSAMIFDDHDVHDDWNASWAWVEEIRTKPWWEERIASAFSSYWIYQHLGNLSPKALAEEGLLERVREAPDGGAILRDFALKSDRGTSGSKWTYCRDFGRTRLIVIDSRAGRRLAEDRRDMLDEEEWAYIERHAAGDFDHLLLATSLPWLLAPALHHTEAWNEAVCDGAWGTMAARLGEKVRQGLDLEHWAAFDHSFRRLTGLVRSVASGECGNAPASVMVLSGDVHHAYLAEAAFPRSAKVASAVYQVTCSPLRNPLDSRERRMFRMSLSGLAEKAARLMARAAGVRDHGIRWRLAGEGPWFDNQVATLELDDRRSRLRFEKTLPQDHPKPRLHEVFERRLT